VNTHNVTGTFICSLLEKFPGLYFREIARAANLPIGTLDYNLRKLKKRNVVVDELVFDKRRYFLSSVDLNERRIIAMLRERAVRKILALVDSQHNLTYNKFSKMLGISKSSVSWYINRLKDESLLSVILENGKRAYSVQNKETVWKLLARHKESFSDRMLNNFISLWDA